MKNFILLVWILGLTETLYGSWFQEHCSNGESVTSISSGHNFNRIQVTLRSWSKGKITDDKIMLDDVKVEQLDQTVLSKSQNNSCREGDSFGVVSWQTISYQKVKITNSDGSPFDGRIVGFQADGSIEAFLICELHGNSEIQCP